MLHEAEAIPYAATRLRGERLLVLAPHPDDEVIGCGGLVAQHAREERGIRVLIATDGAEADANAKDRESYRSTREQESRQGLQLLGVEDVHFLRYPDRGLEAAAVAADIRRHMVEFRPDLIAVPSPVEIHPDHFALSRAFFELIQRDETLFAELAMARVAFYEVSSPIRPNTLVDITDVAALKQQAIAAHASQTGLRDYTAFAAGLNAYRTMTLPGDCKAAEAYYVIELASLRTMPLSELRKQTGSAPELEVVAEPLPIAVVVRTKDRPALLRDALASIRASGYPAEVIVVNDGGARPDIGGPASAGQNAESGRLKPALQRLIEHETSRGRSEAANAGVRAATSAFVTFLDDDDLHYAEHLPTLANAARGSQHAGWYSDAVSAFLRPGESGKYETHSRLRLYGHDFDRDLLLIDNYIPLPTLLVPRATFLDLGGFDPAFDLFEDWDFIIRLAQRGDLLHVPRVTCEVRHFEGGGSIILSAPEGSARFREAKQQVWSKHAELLGNDVIANAFERQKRRLIEQQSKAVEALGNAAHGRLDIDRLEREKNELIHTIQQDHDVMNGLTMRANSLEAAKDEARQAYERLIADLVRERDGRVSEADRAARENGELRAALDQSDAALKSARVEISRLQGLLDMIFGSRTWKVHTLMEKLRGRG
jgi:LmbE family N-acetylglucosaminyl deacetylase/glycosyltransferase involved in cell wall biosynthesis